MHEEVLRNWRVDQILTSELFGLFPADSEEARDILAFFGTAALPEARYSSMIQALLADAP